MLSNNIGCDHRIRSSVFVDSFNLELVFVSGDKMSYLHTRSDNEGADFRPDTCSLVEFVNNIVSHSGSAIFFWWRPVKSE